MSPKRDLIERLEKLEGPDRAVDHAIHAITNPPLRDGLRFGSVPAYSASLDAAVALVERALPGCGYSVEHLPCYGPHHSASVWSSTAITIGNGRGLSSAIALLIAALRALSQETSK